MARPQSTYTARCFSCGHPLQVGLRAQSARCPSCSTGLNLPDIIIAARAPFLRTTTRPTAGRTQTCGSVQIRRKARLRASLVQAGAGVQVLGELVANVLTAGPMHIGPHARFKGDCHAASLIVDLGARIEGGYFNIPGTPAPSHASPANDTVQSSHTRARSP